MKDWYSRDASIQEPLKEKLVSHIYKNSLKDYNDLVLMTSQTRELCALYLDCRDQSFSPNFLSKKGGVICFKKHDYWDNGTEFFELIPVLKYDIINKRWDIILDKPTEHKYYGPTHLQSLLYGAIKRELLCHIKYYNQTYNYLVWNGNTKK